jgi:hypothetical protein
MACNMNTSVKNRCNQLLPMMYGLNNSFGKLLMVGLENSASGKKDFEPVVRIGAQNFVPFIFSTDCWKAFNEHLGEIEEFFTTYNEEPLLDKCLTIPGYTIRFMISYSDRAFELVEDLPKPPNADVALDVPPLPPKKRCRHPARSLVFKRVTFERLKDLAKCVDYRIKYLTKIKKSMGTILDEITDYAKVKLQDEQNSQYTYYSAMNIKYVMRDVDDEFINNVNIVLKQNNLSIAIEDLQIIVHELVNLHLYTLVSTMNENINK